MTSRISVECYNPVDAHKSIQAVLWPWVKTMCMAGHKITVEARKQTRSLAENALLHALLTEISNQVDWAGAKRDPEVWKRLLTAAWLRARGESVELLPALDGFGVDVVFRRTSELTRSECAELIEFIHAWAADKGVKFSAPEYAE